MKDLARTIHIGRKNKVNYRNWGIEKLQWRILIKYQNKAIRICFIIPQ